MKTRFVDLSHLKEASAFLSFGVVHETDEGAAAHSWRLLIAGELTFPAHFVIRWSFRQPRDGLQVLALELCGRE